MVGRGGCSLFCHSVTEAMPLVSTPKHHRHPLDLDRGGLPNPLVHQLLQHLARKPSYAERAEKAPSLQKPENTRNEMPSPGSRRNLRTKASNLAKKKNQKFDPKSELGICLGSPSAFGTTWPIFPPTSATSRPGCPSYKSEAVPKVWLLHRSL